MSEVFRVEEDDCHGDVIAEHPDHVLRQRQHLGQAAVINAVCCTTQGTPVKQIKQVFLQLIQFRVSSSSVCSKL
jgi:hypothetical protein